MNETTYGALPIFTPIGKSLDLKPSSPCRSGLPEANDQVYLCVWRLNQLVYDGDDGVCITLSSGNLFVY